MWVVRQLGFCRALKRERRRDGLAREGAAEGMLVSLSVSMFIWLLVSLSGCCLSVCRSVSLFVCLSSYAHVHGDVADNWCPCGPMRMARAYLRRELETERVRRRERQTDTQTDREVERTTQTGIQAEIERDRWADTETNASL